MGIWDSVRGALGIRRRGESEQLLAEFQDKIQHHFANVELLRVALTHRSFARSGEKDWLPSNERLEFLGDSVLGLVVSEFLYGRFPTKSEGGLTKLKSLLVNETALFRVSEALDLGRFILLSQEEVRAGGRCRVSINADSLEAVIGALYLDGGLGAVRPMINRYIISQMEKIEADDSFRNHKGELLELLQGRGEGMPRYEVIDERGPDHEKTFTVVVYTNGRKIGSGLGPSKKDAEQEAAAEALRSLMIEGERPNEAAT
jgi:ribonuclease III